MPSPAFCPAFLRLSFLDRHGSAWKTPLTGLLTQRCFHWATCPPIQVTFRQMESLRHLDFDFLFFCCWECGCTRSLLMILARQGLSARGVGVASVRRGQRRWHASLPILRHWAAICVSISSEGSFGWSWKCAGLGLTLLVRHCCGWVRMFGRGIWFSGWFLFV